MSVYEISQAVKQLTSCNPTLATDGGYTDWSEPSECRATCGRGVITFTRT